MNAYDNTEYILRDTPVDNIRKPGISTVIKNLSTLTNVSRYNTAGWDLKDSNKNVLNDDGKFIFVIPLKILIRRFEKTTLKPEPQPIIRMNQELRFTRGGSDTKDCLIVKDHTEYEIIYEDIYIRMPEKILTELANTNLNQDLVAGKEYTTKFYHWDYTYTKIPVDISHYLYDMPSIYDPHCIFIVLQTKRGGDITKDISKFDDLSCVNTQIVFRNVQFPAQYQEDIVKKYIDYQNMEHRFKKTNPNKTLLTFQQLVQKFPIDATDSTGIDPQLIKKKQ